MHPGHVSDATGVQESLDEISKRQRSTISLKRLPGRDKKQLFGLPRLNIIRSPDIKHSGTSIFSTLNPSLSVINLNLYLASRWLMKYNTASTNRSCSFSPLKAADPTCNPTLLQPGRRGNWLYPWNIHMKMFWNTFAFIKVTKSK